MHVDKTPCFTFIESTLDAMRRLQIPVSDMDCPCCGYGVRFPIVARQSDIELFEQLISCAEKVMDEYGITANLLAAIKAECLIAMASRRQKK